MIKYSSTAGKLDEEVAAVTDMDAESMHVFLTPEPPPESPLLWLKQVYSPIISHLGGDRQKRPERGFKAKYRER